MSEETPAVEARTQSFVSISEDTPIEWSRLESLGFRIAFCFLLMAAVSVTEVMAVVPLVGGPIKEAIDSLWERMAVWLGQHWFHLTGIAAHPHAAASRDTALSWIVMGLVGVGALICATVWTAVDKRREYRNAAAWLRCFLRLTLVFLMFRYGMFKVFPLQMAPPSLAVLNEPVGQMSQMTLLWRLIGLHPAYEIVCGAIEMAAGVLLLFRRTALLGGLLTVVVMTNVLLYNLFFDVPVKLGAAIVLVFAAAVIVPDLNGLYQFFWRHELSAAASDWAPQFRQRIWRTGLRIAELGFAAIVLFDLARPAAQALAQQEARLRNPSPLTGEWRVESYAFGRPVLTGEGLPMTALFLEPNGLAMARSSDGKLWRANVAVNLEKHRLALSSGYFDGERFNAAYQLEQPDAGHLILTPLGRYGLTNGRFVLARVALPKEYPLLSDGFRWVSEFPLER